MWRRNPILLATAKFVFIFGLLIFPWPGWNQAYSGYFRGLGDAVFSRPDDQRIVLFRAKEMQHGFSSLDSQMVIGNRASVDSSGKGLSKVLSLDTRSIGWTPTALTIALILSTPVPWRQRGWALVWGVILIHVFILFSLQVAIWNQSPALSLLDLSPFWKEMVDALDYTLLVQLGASFSVPILIWILVTIRRQDLFRIAGGNQNDRREFKLKKRAIAPGPEKSR
jgi:hypothetical protein